MIATTQEAKEKAKLEAKHAFWRKSKLFWKCHKVQKEMYDIFYKAPKNSTLVWLLPRQFGKSFLIAILAIEQALMKEHAIIKITTDTKGHIESILEPIFRDILVDCPSDLKPDYKKVKYTYYFPNGSQIQLAGTDNKHYEKLRGQKSDLVFVDEAGFCNDLEEIIESVLFPTTTHTGGNIVLASTPPPESDHHFLKYIEKAELEDLLTKKTIYENPLLTPEQIERIAKKMGGKYSERFRREYLCSLVKDSNSTVIPEFDKDLEDAIVKDWPLPPYYDCYESMDLGGKDLTVILFAYFDFRADKIIIQDELIINFQNANETIPNLVKKVQNKEEELWKNPLTHEIKVPHARVSDINYIVTQEILRYSGNKMHFTITRKDDNESAINDMRTFLGSQKIIIHPRCQTLIRHLRNVKWNKNRNNFARSPDNGHYDAVDALKYLIRNIAYGRNPYPAHYGLNLKDLHVHNPEKFYSQDPTEAYRKIFNLRPKRK